MNPNPTGCCGMDIPCCPDTQVPRVGLVASLMVDGECECLGDATVTLEPIDDESGEWHGSGEFGNCGREIDLTMRCVEVGAGGHEFVLDVSFSDECAESQEGVQSSIPPACSPVAAEFPDIVPVPNCCNDGMAGMLTVTVSEPE